MAFKKQTGLSPSVCLEKLRIHNAAELLLLERKERGNLTEIARRSGFRDAWYMSKRFRKVQGISPTAYRNGFLPKRILSLQHPYASHMLALDVAPAAARFSAAQAAIAPERREGIVNIPSLLSPEGLEQLVESCEPDLILAYDTDAIGQRLRRMAPVLQIPWLSLSWREHLSLIGRLLHKEEEASDYISMLDDKAERIRALVHERMPATTVVSIFKIADKRCYLYGSRDTGCIFYEFLRFPSHPYMAARLAQDPNLHSVEISLRRMKDYAGDLNVVILCDLDEQGQAESLMQLELASSRPVVYLNQRDWLTYDPLHIQSQLDQIGLILLNNPEYAEQYDQ